MFLCERVSKENEANLGAADCPMPGPCVPIRRQAEGLKCDCILRLNTGGSILALSLNGYEQAGCNVTPVCKWNLWGAIHKGHSTF